MPERLIGKMRRRISYFIDDSPEAHTKSQQKLSESFCRSLTTELQIPVDSFDIEEIKRWIIGFNKLFVKKIDDKVVINTPSESDMAVFGKLLGQMIANAIIGDDEQQKEEKPQQQVVEDKEQQKEEIKESEEQLPRVRTFLT